MARKVDRAVKVLSEAELQKLPLPRLRAYLKRLHQVHDEPSWSNDATTDAARRKSGWITRCDPEWYTLLDRVHAELERRDPPSLPPRAGYPASLR